MRRLKKGQTLAHHETSTTSGPEWTIGRNLTSWLLLGSTNTDYHRLWYWLVTVRPLGIKGLNVIVFGHHVPYGEVHASWITLLLFFRSPTAWNCVDSDANKAFQVACHWSLIYLSPLSCHRFYSCISLISYFFIQLSII